MKVDLSGKVALVCGASKGIGAALAASLAECGARVILVARKMKELEDQVSKIPGNGHAPMVADLARPSDITQLTDYLADHPVDIVVNNTGGPPPGPIAEANIEDFEKALQMHLYASHQIMQAVLPAMKSKGYGRFINVISTSVKIPIPGLGVSNTTRGAMASWAKTLSSEVAPFSITVNNILPGAVETTRLEAIIVSQAQKAGITEEAAAERMKQEIPAGRFGRPQELGDLAAFLASERAAYITGVSIPVDGGKTGSL